MTKVNQQVILEEGQFVQNAEEVSIRSILKKNQQCCTVLDTVTAHIVKLSHQQILWQMMRSMRGHLRQACH